MYPPEPLLGAALPYQIEHTLRELIPLRRQHGDWRKFSPMFWRYLDETGPEKMVLRLTTIAAQNAGKKPLCLLCFEDLQRGQLCHRVIFAAWWRERSGQEVFELTSDGELLKLEQLHHQILPVRPR